MTDDFDAMPGEQSGKRALLGVAGWQHGAWNDVFYPHDMPSDWRLAYYNTQFPCVWLERDKWAAAPLSEIAQWVEDTHESFRFLLEASESKAAGERLDLLEPRLGLVGEATDPDMLWFDKDTPLRELSERIQREAADGHPIYLLSRDADLGKLEQVRTLIQLLGL